MDDIDDLIEDGFDLHDEEPNFEDQFDEHYGGASKRPLTEHSGNIPFSSAPDPAAKRAKSDALLSRPQQQQQGFNTNTLHRQQQQQQRQPLLPAARQTSTVAEDLSAEPEGIAAAGRTPGSVPIRRRLYPNSTPASRGLDPGRRGDVELSQSQGDTGRGGYSESQAQLSQDTEDALAESLAAAEEAAAEAASAWLPPARTSLHFPGEVMSVTSQSSERVYCQVRDQEPAAAAAGAGRRGGGGGGGAARQLLMRPMRELLREAEEQLLQRTLRLSANEAAAAAAGPTPTGAGATPPAPEQELWVDKYSPKTFLELLSDESVNRSVVKWLKSWDACVFGGGGGGGGGGGAPYTLSTAKQRAESRPQQRILLMSGAPGLGKTTLAHVVARHCGYRPVEINASDDRSAAALTCRITDAAQMQSVVGDRRPNCIIIDEIDGAAGGAEARSAVLALIKLVQGGIGGGGGGGKPTGGGDGEADAGAEASTKRRKRGGQPLCRPIICVCNDLYAPVMRPLRDVAAVYQFKQPLMERLISRMRQICVKEKLFADRQALTMLAERTECDVRSCLNTLQFLGRRQRSVRTADVAHAAAGQKDISRSAFAVWQELFWHRGNKQALRRGESRAERMARLFGLLADFGESELMLAGCHENVPHMRFMDTCLTKMAAMSATMGGADVMQRAMGRTMDFGLMRYLPAAVLSVAAQAAGPERVQLQWPKAITEARRMGDSNASTLRDWLAATAPAVLQGLNPRTAVLEVLPSLLPLLSPQLRPVAERLLNPEERRALRDVTHTMLAYGVRFDQRSVGPTAATAAAAAAAVAATGGRLPVTYLPLNPPVDRFCAFQELPLPGRPLSEAVQQLIGSAVQMEAIRRREEARGIVSAPYPIPSVDGPAADSAAEPSRLSTPSTPSMAPIPLTVAERARAAAAAMGRGRASGPKRKGTWLDKLKVAQEARQVGGRQEATAAAGQPGSKARPTVLYRFKEGYTNAVKRPVIMKELL